MHAPKQKKSEKEVPTLDGVENNISTPVSESVQCHYTSENVVQREEGNVSEISTPNQTGMPDRLKSGLENLSGFDLSSVRVHYNSAKPRQMGALAYAQGTNIHLGAGQEKHLPHEGWHVVQQMQGRVQPTIQMKGIGVNDDRGLEREADMMGARAIQLKSRDTYCPPQQELFITNPTAQMTIQLPTEVSVEESSDQFNGAVLRFADQPPVIQLFQAQVIATGKGVITDIKLTGRTPSPFTNTMGAHSTAWIVHTDGVRRQLQGLTLDSAITRMIILLGEATSSPQMRLARSNDIFGSGPAREKAIASAIALAKLGCTGKSETGKTVWLEDFIDAYLNVVNHLPLSTVESGKKTGNSEGEARGNLIWVESGGEDDVRWIQENFAILFATDTPAAFIKDVPFGYTKPDIGEVWAIAIFSFLRGLRHAYPNAYEQAELNEAKMLEAFLLNLHKDVPANILQRLGKFGDVGVSPEKTPNQFLEGGTGSIVGGDLAVQVRFSKGIVDEVRMEGRTPSPFVGSMGAHSTAWIAHLDALRAVLHGQNLAGAIQAILILSQQAQTSPLINFVPYILPDQARLLARSQVELQYFQRIILEKGASELLATTRLQQLIAAYLQFSNALPLHTAEAADTSGNTEGYYRNQLFNYEMGNLRAIRARRKTGNRRAIKAVSLKAQLETAFWTLYDPGSASAFTENLFPSAVPSPKVRKRIDGRPSRKGASTSAAVESVKTSNKEKSITRETAFDEKPLEAEEIAVLKELQASAVQIISSDASVLLPRAMALHGFLHAMETAYPRSYTDSWEKQDKVARSRLIECKLRVDGEELLNLMSTLPKLKVLRGNTKLVYKMPMSMSSSSEPNFSRIKEKALREYEQACARRDGISAQYVIGHASGDWNACLIYSLLRHALNKEPTSDEVNFIRRQLNDEYEDIANGEQINIYTETGHAVIQTIEASYGVSLNVSVVTTRDAPIVPVTQGLTEALLYLMPGHFAPCWRRG